MLALIGFAAGSVTFLGSVVEGTPPSRLLWGGVGLIIVALLVLRRRSYRRTNEEAGNALLALQLQARREEGRPLTVEEERFLRRARAPWWRNWHWLWAGGRALDKPRRS